MKKIYACIFFAAFFTTNAQVITTVAGNGIFGDIGNGGPATSAKLYYPTGVAIDTAGNIYITDTDNNRIQKVSPSGIINNIAGVAPYGYSGDGGPATNANLHSPTGIAVDIHGNIYFSDRDNSVVRMIKPNGIITTIAGNGTPGQSGDGGLATSAQLDHPEGVAVDTAGNVFIVNYARNFVRKINTSGIISTIAGNGSPTSSGDGGLAVNAGLNYPHGVQVDNAGNVYISESNKIRKINSSGIISTIAGWGNMCNNYTGNGGFATNAQLCDPWYIAVDGIGNIYFADQSNNITCKINTSGVITKIAGNGYLAGTGNGGYSGDGGPATGASLFLPTGIAVDAPGNVFIADNGNHRIRKVSTSGIITTFAGTGFPGHTSDEVPATQEELFNLKGVITDNVGNAFITDDFGYKMRKIDQRDIIKTVAGNDTSGYKGDGGQAVSAELFQPLCITKDRIGNLYFTDYGSIVRKIDTSGVITTVAGTPNVQSYSGDGGLAINATLNQPRGLTFDASGNLYIADYANNVVRRVNASGIISTFAGTGFQSYGGDGGPATLAYLWGPSGVAADASGNIYIIDEAYALIRKVDNSGIINRIAGIPNQHGYSPDGALATSAKINPTGGIVCDPTGNVYISDGNNIRKIDLTGVLTTIAGHDTLGYLTGFSGDGGPANKAKLNGPTAIAFDGSGNLYIADAGNYRLRKVTPCSSPTSTLSVSASGLLVCAGDSVTLTASGSATVSWTCNKACIIGNKPTVTVNPYITTTFFATGYDNSGCICRDSIVVNVNPKPSISYTLQPDPTPHVWNAYPIYSGGTQPYTYNWNWNDGSPNATTAYPSHTYSVANFYNICATITDINGCYATYCLNDSLYRLTNSSMVQLNVINGQVDIKNESKKNDQMIVYPNPGRDDIIISTTRELGSVTVLNSLGEIVLQMKSKNKMELIDISKLASGVYFIRATNSQVKFIKE